MTPRSSARWMVRIDSASLPVRVEVVAGHRHRAESDARDVESADRDVLHERCAPFDRDVVLRSSHAVSSGQRRGQLAVGVDLLLERGDLLLGRGDGVGAGDEAPRRLLLVGDRQQRLGELGRVADLLAVLALPELELRGVALGVVLDRRRGVVRRLLREELGAEEPRVDDGRVDAERRDLGRERLHPALDAELRRGVGGAELEAGESRRRGDRDDVPGALLAHDRQDSAGDVHRADQARRQLPLHLLGGQLLEVAGVEAGGVVDQHVDAAEAIDGGPDRRLGVLRARDVELDDQQVVRRRRAASATASGLRPVATTAWPAASAALAKSTPMPRPAPVMNQIFLLLMSSVLSLSAVGGCLAASVSKKARDRGR